MRSSVLGGTDLQVAALSYGGSALGSVFGAIDEQDGIRAVHTALDGGMNLVDVAPFYGLTTAETLLGKALKDRPRDSYILSSKAGRNGQAKFDFSTGAIIRSAEASLRRLGVDYLDILLLHDIEYHGQRYLRQALEEGILALQQLRAAGKIRFCGVSAYPVGLLQEVLAQVELDVVLCHNHYTLTDTQLLKLAPSASARRVGLIAASPLGMGLLSERGAPHWHPAQEPDRMVVRHAAQFCRAHGTTLERLALQFATANPLVPTMLVSSSSSQQVRENLATVEQPVDWELISQVQTLLAPLKDRDWNFGS